MTEKKDYLLCNAGYNVASVLPDGSVNKCYNRQDENIGNIFKKIEFSDELVKCKSIFCDCPLYAFEPHLHKIAKKENKEGDYIPDYDVFMHWHITFSCNLFCKYCIVQPGNPELDVKLKGEPTRPIDIEAVIKTLDDTGKTFFISFIGGEPFLIPNMNELCQELTKKHYVTFNSNFSVIDPVFFDIIPHDRIHTIHLSLHIESMDRLGLTDQWIRNVNAMQKSGFDKYFITVVAHPDVLKNANEHIERFKKHNIEFKYIPMLAGPGTSGNGKAYPESYTKEEIKLIDKDWLKDYFPVNYENDDVADMNEYHDPIHNPEVRGEKKLK